MPVVKLDYLNTKMDSTYVNEAQPTTLGHSGSMMVGGLTTVNRGLLKFDLGLIPNNAIINSATYYLVGVGTYIPTVNVHNLQGEFSQSVTSWNNQPSFDSEIEATFKMPGNSAYINLDLTSLVQKWVDGPNHGMLFEADGDKSTQPGYISGSANGTLAQRPYLTIDYSIPTVDKKQVEYVSVTTETPPYATGFNLNIPTEARIGDMLVALVTTVGGSSANPSTLDTPNGWTLKYKELVNGQQYAHVFYKVLDGTEIPVSFTGNLSFYATVSLYVLRNAKVINKHYSRVTTSGNYTFPYFIGSVPQGSLMFLYTNKYSPTVSATSPINFTEVAELSNQSSGQVVALSYNHDKQSFTKEELTTKFSGNSDALSMLLSVQPITNEAPKIDGQDEDLGAIDSSLLKAYSVTDNEGETITITEKVDGAVIRTYTGTGAQTLDLSTVWANLAVGKHTITIEANDTYDTNRKSIRTWTFLKILNPNDDLVTAVEGLGDLEAIVDRWKQQLVDKVGGSVSDTFEDIIESLVIGKQVKESTFTQNGVTLAITGLGFTPRIILLRLEGSISYHYYYNSDINSSNMIGARGGSLVTLSGLVQPVEDGFTVTYNSSAYPNGVWYYAAIE